MPSPVSSLSASKLPHLMLPLLSHDFTSSTPARQVEATAFSRDEPDGTGKTSVMRICVTQVPEGLSRLEINNMLLDEAWGRP